MPDTTPVISAKNLNLWYGDFKALKNISEGTDLEDYMDIDNLLKYMAVHIFPSTMTAFPEIWRTIIISMSPAES